VSNLVRFGGVAFVTILENTSGSSVLSAVARSWAREIRTYG
jgi:hypothetical protein